MSDSSRLSTGAVRMIESYRLARHPEGGWYRRVATSTSLSDTLGGSRPSVTSILYLLARGDKSRPHRVRSDEIWHHLAGDPLRLADVVDGRYRETHLCARPPSSPVHLVPGGAWQAAESLGEWSLAGCTVAPGFDFADFEIAAGETLAALVAAAPGMARFVR